VFENNTHSFKAGVDYFIDNKNTLGAQVIGNLADNVFNTEGPMYFTYIPTNELVRILKATNTNDMNRDNVTNNINFKHIDGKGKS
jgi:hypothetical protein